MPRLHRAVTPTPEPDRVLRYADHADGIIDLYLPPRRATSPAPLIVAIHGGYWRARHDRLYLRPLCRALADRGYAVALPEFRRTDGGGGEWPVIGADIEAARHYLTTPEPDSSAPEFDPRAPYCLIGHSAGGHLALWAGLRAGTARCQGIVALAPVADLYEAASRHLSNGAAQILLDGEPEQQPTRYAEANPATYLPSDVPVTIIHGDTDSDVPVDISRNFAAAHPEISYREIRGADHFALIDPHHETFRDAVVPAIAATTADFTRPTARDKG